MNNITGEDLLATAMMSGKKGQRAGRNTPQINDEVYRSMVEKTTYFFIYREKIMELVLSLFKWSNLPDSMNARHLENTLHRQGSAVITKHKDTGNIVNLRLGASKSGLDIYGEPSIFDVHGHDYYNTVNASNAVIVYNNKLRRNTYRIVNHIAFKLAEADLVISQNLNAQSMPFVITGPESKKKDIVALMGARGNFLPVIIGNKGLADDIKVEVLTTGVPYIIDKIDTHKHVIWNEGMTFLGVDNANQEKKERMITGEINANDEQTNMFQESMFMEREEAVNKVNEMFGTNIKVEFNNEIMDELSEMMNKARIEEVESMTELNKADANLKYKQAEDVDNEADDIHRED